MSTKKVIHRWFDRHLHVRDGAIMRTVLPWTVRQQATGAVIMGNHPLSCRTMSIATAIAYRKRIQRALGPDCGFKPCMTCYLTDHITPEEVVRGFREGVWCAVKLYMANQDGQGGTTGSTHGVRDLKGRYPVFAAMEENRIPLLGHFEATEDDVDEFDREIVSLERDVLSLVKAFPELQIVFEHITDGRAADVVAENNHNIYATVTLHHLRENRNALFRGGLNSEKWCKPVLKREEYRQRIRRYVTSGHPCFGAGTDSAPHREKYKKQCSGCAAGICTAYAAVEGYATVFDEDGALEHLDAFLSQNFVYLYGMEPSQETMTLERIPSEEIPEKVGTIRLYHGGKRFPWRIAA